MAFSSSCCRRRASWASDSMIIICKNTLSIFSSTRTPKQQSQGTVSCQLHVFSFLLWRRCCCTWPTLLLSILSCFHMLSNLNPRIVFFRSWIEQVRLLSVSKLTNLLAQKLCCSEVLSRQNGPQWGSLPSLWSPCCPSRFWPLQTWCWNTGTVLGDMGPIWVWPTLLWDTLAQVNITVITGCNGNTSVQNLHQ